MGILSDGPAVKRTRGGRGGKMLRLYESMDEADRALIRTWVERGEHIQYVYNKLHEHHDIGYSTVAGGIERLVESQWEC